MSRPESTPRLETIRHAWEYLRPLMQQFIRRPDSATLEKEVSEEIYKFDAILKGDLNATIMLFRDSIYHVKREHEDTKAELQHLQQNLDTLYRSNKMLPHSPTPSMRDMAPPSPIPFDDSHD